jgi:Caspase domain
MIFFRKSLDSRCIRRSLRPPGGAAILCSLLFLTICRSASSDADDRFLSAPWLEIPDASSRVPANSSLTLTAAPQSVQQIVLHIPVGGSRISYGMIHTKVNTEATDVAMKSSSASSGFALKIDLTAAGGFPLRRGPNSVELEYEDQFGRSRYFNFILNVNAGGAAGTRDVPILPSGPPEHRSGRLMAVVIGISQYADKTGRIPQLKYADRDAESFAAFLRSPAGGSIAEDNLDLLLNGDATIENVRRALFTFLARTHPEDTVVIFIAGHGAPDPHDTRNLYFLATDSHAEDMGGTAFPMWQLQDVFARVLKAKHVVTLVDTCRSYGFTGLRQGDTQEVNNLFNQYLERYASGTQRAVITASDIGELALEKPEWGGGHGVFTWFLLRGLQGDADRNHDGIVTAGELFAYLQQSVGTETHGKQNPRAMDGLATALIVSETRKLHSAHS